MSTEPHADETKKTWTPPRLEDVAQDASDIATGGGGAGDFTSSSS